MSYAHYSLAHHCRVHRRVILLVVTLIVSHAGMARGDMWIREFNAQRHLRFYAGVNKEFFIGQDFDWSGVGRTDNDRWATMVSPSYFLSAAHFAPAIGSQLTFHAGNTESGDKHVYTIADGGLIYDEGAGTDLWLGRLTTPLSAEDNIRFYPVLVKGNTSSYSDMELFNYGLRDRVGRNVMDVITEATVSGVRAMSMTYDYDKQDAIDVGGDETFLLEGDSGAPSFAVWGGELALLGIHWFNDVDSSLSGDTFVPHYVDEINDRMTGDDTLTVIPEPSALTLFGSALGCLALGSRYCRARKRRMPAQGHGR